ncbi:ATP synthase F1 subunit delta [Vulgatibacter sp.]|uniref:ATP synthase F1 subunit delta n=1 Tax=Vulgatibacter sp. TaxID=1971226 RepID=UPI003566DEC7
MIQQSIARRYARALFESVGTDLERAGNELAGTANALEESPEVAAVFTDPRFDKSTRDRTLEQILAAGGFHPMVANLLRLLNDRERMSELPQIARVFRDMVDEQVGRVRARVTSATVLPAEMVQSIANALSKATSKQVVLEADQDPAILGGLVAHVGNVVYDGSLRTQLESLRRELNERA